MLSLIAYLQARPPTNHVRFVLSFVYSQEADRSWIQYPSGGSQVLMLPFRPWLTRQIPPPGVLEEFREDKPGQLLESLEYTSVALDDVHDESLVLPLPCLSQHIPGLVDPYRHSWWVNDRPEIEQFARDPSRQRVVVASPLT